MAVAYGKYLLERKLAEGGMAEIFLARPNPATAPQLVVSLAQAGRNQIVVKRLFSHHSDEAEFVRMFFNESRLAARLKHPNIVDIFDQGEVDGTYYLAMEFINGEDLRGIAQQADNVGKRPPFAIVCRIIIDMLAGLHYAHTLRSEAGEPLGLVHRDISPQNVLVTYEGDTKLIDFGIAKATQSRDHEQTQAGLIKGKYAYMSPEQTRSGKLDARSDVFSAGVLLWELIAWRRLFKRQTDLATLVAVTEEPAPSMTITTPDVPKELDDITLRALAMEPGDRWGSAKEFMDALLACIDNQGWDGSHDALARYMKELFPEKLLAQQIAARQTPTSQLSGRVPASQVSGRAQTGPSASRPRAMTMPLQIVNPAMVQAARKAMVTKPGAAPPPLPTSGRSQSPSNQSSGSSGPVRIPTSGVSTQTTPNPSSQSASLRRTPPSGTLPSNITQPSPSDPGMTVPMERARLSPLMMPTVTQPPSRRVLWAVLIGVFFGVAAVLILQYLARQQGG